MYNVASEATIRKIGNSYGILLPKEFIREEGLSEDEKVLISIVKKANLLDIFGSLKRDVPGQKFKDMVRKGWSR